MKCSLNLPAGSGVGIAFISLVFTCFPLVDKARFAPLDLGVTDGSGDSSAGFRGVLEADFLAGGVCFTAVAGLGLSAFRVLIIDLCSE